jgi:hypothetical protein
MRAPSEMPDALAARQWEQHRLRKRVWPPERPSRNADPWLILDLEQAVELVKQVAVGPKTNLPRPLPTLPPCEVPGA